METKKCAKCGRELPLTEFYKNSRNRDGLQSYCKDCHKERSLTYYYKRKSMAESAPPDPQLDSMTRREVMDIMMRCKRWLEAQGCTIHLSGEYHEIKKLKF